MRLQSWRLRNPCVPWSINISPTTVFHEEVCPEAKEAAACLPSPVTSRHYNLNHKIARHCPLAVSTRSVILIHILLQYKVQVLFQPYFLRDVYYWTKNLLPLFIISVKLLYSESSVSRVPTSREDRRLVIDSCTFPICMLAR